MIEHAEVDMEQHEPMAPVGEKSMRVGTFRMSARTKEQEKMTSMNMASTSRNFSSSSCTTIGSNRI
jgi:hypothetical protein